MKKIYIILLFAATSLFYLNAQPKLSQKTHGIVAGDSHEFLFTDPVNEGLAGKNITWDFSYLKETGKTLTSHMFSAIETPKGAEISGANTAIEEFNNVFYFKETAERIEHIGYVSGNTVIIYDKPLLKLKFPLKYGDKFTGEYSGSQNTGSTEFKFTGTYEISSDATGKLLLPNGIVVNNTIRVKQTRTYSCPTGCNYSEVVYRWYGKDVHYPLLVIIKNLNAKGEITSSLTAYHSVMNPNIAPVEKESLLSNNSIDLQYFPNPMGNKLSIKYILPEDGKVEVSIYDFNGALVKNVVPSTQQAKGSYSYSITDESLKAGVYFLKIKHGNNVISKKLIKAF